MSTVITVRFRDRPASVDFNSTEYSYFVREGLYLEPEDYVLVPTLYGPNIAMVSRVTDISQEKKAKATRWVTTKLEVD